MPKAFLSLIRPLLVAGLLALVAIVYWPALRGGFIFDDYPIFAENTSIQVHGWHWQSWQGVWQWAIANIERPMAMLTYALNYALGSGTFGFKLTNLVIHLLNSLLVVVLVKRLLHAAWPKLDAKGVFAWTIGIACAWALHPLQVSTVMYVVQRMEMLAFTFVLLSLLAYWRGREAQLAGHRVWHWFLLSVVAVLAGYCFKETAILAPGYALLIELTLLRFKAAEASVERRWQVLYAAGVAFAAIVAIAYIFPHYSNPAYYAGREFTAWQRELTQLRALPLYLGWILLPLPRHLSFYYDDYVASIGLLHPATTLFGGLLLLALLIFAVLMYRRRPLMALGIGWFFIAHALTSAPIPLELVFEHRNYPALLGIVLAVADLFYWLACRSKSSVIIVIACLLVCNLAFLTALRAKVWSSPYQLAAELVDLNPKSNRAALDLARRFMAMSGGNTNSPLYTLSIKELERAALLPSASPLAEEALLLEASRNPGLATQPWWESIRHKLETRPLTPDSFLALHHLASTRLEGNDGIDAQQLADCFAILVRRIPGREVMQADYAELLGGVLKQPAAAIDHWKLALSLDPDASTYGSRLATYLVSRHRNEEAVAVIVKTMELRPVLQNDRAFQALLAKAKSDDAAIDSSPARPASGP
jgi:hypothetical protein